MIDLNTTKMVLLDFDETLCVHTFHGTQDYAKHNSDIVIGKNVWETDEKNIHLEKFMRLCEKKGILLGLISATMSYKHMVAKNKWVYDNYHIALDNFCVGESTEDKITMMIAIADAYSFERKDIMLIDDMWQTLHNAANEGFAAHNPMEVVNFIENLKL
jgi:hypothetical protein